MNNQLSMTVDDHLVNPEAIKLASAALRMHSGHRPGLQKAAFIPGGDPSMTGGGGGAPPPGGGGAPPPGMDPSMMGGGAPPPGGDPSGGMGGGGLPPGMDPSMMMGGGGGGAPPPPPPSSSGGGGDNGAITAKLDQLIQIMQGGGVGGQSGQNAAGQIKPKIDVNVAIMQISKMIARIADALGIKIPASEMIATPTDLTQMAGKQMASGQEDASMAPGAGGGGAGGAGGMPGSIQPMQGMADMGAGPGKTGSDSHDRGTAYNHTSLEGTMNKAAAWLRLLKGPQVAA